MAASKRVRLPGLQEETKGVVGAALQQQEQQHAPQPSRLLGLTNVLFHKILQYVSVLGKRLVYDSAKVVQAIQGPHTSKSLVLGPQAMRHWFPWPSDSKSCVRAASTRFLRLCLAPHVQELVMEYDDQAFLTTAESRELVALFPELRSIRLISHRIRSETFLEAVLVAAVSTAPSLKEMVVVLHSKRSDNVAASSKVTSAVLNALHESKLATLTRLELAPRFFEVPSGRNWIAKLPASLTSLGVSMAPASPGLLADLVERCPGLRALDAGGAYACSSRIQPGACGQLMNTSSKHKWTSFAACHRVFPKSRLLELNATDLAALTSDALVQLHAMIIPDQSTLLQLGRALDGCCNLTDLDLRWAVSDNDVGPVELLDKVWTLVLESKCAPSLRRVTVGDRMMQRGSLEHVLRTYRACPRLECYPCYDSPIRGPPGDSNSARVRELAQVLSSPERKNHLRHLAMKYESSGFTTRDYEAILLNSNQWERVFCVGRDKDQGDPRVLRWLAFECPRLRKLHLSSRYATALGDAKEGTPILRALLSKLTDYLSCNNAGEIVPMDHVTLELLEAPGVTHVWLDNCVMTALTAAQLWRLVAHTNRQFKFRVPLTTWNEFVALEASPGDAVGCLSMSWPEKLQGGPVGKAAVAAAPDEPGYSASNTRLFCSKPLTDWFGPGTP